MPDREQIEERFLAVCRRMYERGLVIAREGNVSCRIAPDRFLITPSGKGKGFLRLQDLVVIDGAGRRRGGRLSPSSELAMHLAVYEERPAAAAVVHGHPPTATGFAVAGIPLADCVLPEVVATVGTVPIAEYGTPATRELADSIRPHLRAGRTAMLLKNHGAVACGADLEEAFDLLETIEHFARIVLTARQLGRVQTLRPEDVAKILGMPPVSGAPGKPWRCHDCRGCSAAQRHGAPASAPPSGGAPGAADPHEHLVERVTQIVRRRLGG